MIELHKWAHRFFDMAHLVGSWSKDPSTKVGAVIIRPDRTIASVGYNGFPRGVNDDASLYENREAKLMRTVHAEANAILSAREPLHGYTLIVTPLHPCANCAGLIIQSGIKKVLFQTAAPSSGAWATHFEVMQRMFDQASVAYMDYSPKLKEEIK